MRSLFSSHHVMNSPHFSEMKFTTSSTTGRTVSLILFQASIIDCLNASFSFHSLMKTQTSPTSAATNMLIGLAKSTPHNKPTTLRSEERRVGKESSSRYRSYHYMTSIFTVDN